MRLHFGVPDTERAPVALTIGNFDGVHRGHQAMLARLREAGRRLGLPTAVMSFEPHPREFFRPDDAPARLTSLREKTDLLACEGIDDLYMCHFNAHFAAQTPEAFIETLLVRRLHVRWLLVGDDFRFGARRAGDYPLLVQQGAEHGFAVESQGTVVADGERISSSLVREVLAEGDLAHATRLLGRPWHISGRVAHGDEIGRRWGFPTANLPLRHRRIPVSGIFAARLTARDGVARPSVASLGTRPSVKQAGARLLEVHVFDFDGDLYGQRVQVELLHKFRDEAHFSDLDALRAQIAADAAQARAFLAQAAPAGTSGSIR
jgi:riboflavin kinase/FMN adenylyltransferase